VTHGIANELTLRNKAKLVIKLLIAIRGNYGYLAGWTYPLKIYRKRSQFANKSIICNDAFPLFCEVHLKGQVHLKGRLQLKGQPPLLVPPDVTSRLRQERSLRQPPGLVGPERGVLEQQRLLRLLLRQKVRLQLLAEESFPS
jgi:hypothetical protein